ncbi:MAG: response regulator [Sphingorhabdus sp.]
MFRKLLIVEDEFLVALHLRQIVESLGFEVVGIAADADTALKLAGKTPEIALVDVNLRDGETGPEIGKLLASEYGTTVLFITANPTALGEGIAGVVGVLSKPVDNESVESTLDFLVRHRSGEKGSPPPAIRVFH